ncbi:MAG: hypothetical protein RLZZ491_533 [Pseudomonadota bacterium]|jgi:hypothetical protein
MGDRLGPWPEATVATLADLGLAEDEIARHLRIDRAMVRHLHRRAQRGDGMPAWFDPPGRLDPPQGAQASAGCAWLMALARWLCRR